MVSWSMRILILSSLKISVEVSADEWDASELAEETDRNTTDEGTEGIGGGSTGEMLEFVLKSGVDGVVRRPRGGGGGGGVNDDGELGNSCDDIDMNGLIGRCFLIGLRDLGGSGAMGFDISDNEAWMLREMAGQNSSKFRVNRTPIAI